MRGRIVALTHRNLSVESGVEFARGARIIICPTARCEIGANTVFADRARLTVVSGTVRIGQNVFVGSRASLLANGSLEIGDDGLIAEDVMVQAWTRVAIGKNVWLGAKSIVRDGCVIGDNSVVGAGAEVENRHPPAVKLLGRPAMSRPLI